MITILTVLLTVPVTHLRVEFAISGIGPEPRYVEHVMTMRQCHDIARRYELMLQSYPAVTYLWSCSWKRVPFDS